MQRCSITTQQLSPGGANQRSADPRQKLKWLHYQPHSQALICCTYHHCYHQIQSGVLHQIKSGVFHQSGVFTKLKLVFSINLVFLTKSNLVFCTTNTWWLPRTPSQTAFFTFFPCIFNLSRAILGAVWINLILPQNISLCIQIICSTRTPSDQISGKVSKIWSSSSCIHWYVSWKMNKFSKLESLAQGILSSLKYCML